MRNFKEEKDIGKDGWREVEEGEIRFPFKISLSLEIYINLIYVS